METIKEIIDDMEKMKAILFTSQHVKDQGYVKCINEFLPRLKEVKPEVIYKNLKKKK